MRLTPTLQRVEELIVPMAESMGYELVSLRMMGPRQNRTLQIMAEPAGGAREMTVNDCEKLSRAISALMDVEDPIESAYNLEVSSPGVDRPLVRPRDYTNHIGMQAQVEMELAIDGRRRFTGAIASATETDATLRLQEGNDVTLPLKEMLSAKLVMNDELINFYQRKLKQQETAD